jgi:hypothetical protein
VLFDDEQKALEKNVLKIILIMSRIVMRWMREWRFGDLMGF